MPCVNIRGCCIGEGRPKVILPIVEHTEAAILKKAAQFSTLSADCVEWRVDWFEGFQSPAAIARCVQKLRVALLDIEFFTAGADLPALVEQAHSAGVAVVCSSHDFTKTPPRAELVCRMVQMQQAGADLPKLAVMPRCRTDVLELLAATAEMADLHPKTPVITMSMGALGSVSRLAGEVFGSAMTFHGRVWYTRLGSINRNLLCQLYRYIT